MESYLSNFHSLIQCKKISPESLIVSVHNHEETNTAYHIIQLKIYLTEEFIKALRQGLPVSDT